MQDAPSPLQLLAAVARFLRDDAGPALAAQGDAALAYHAKVAANMIDTAGREITLAPAGHRAELARLQALLGAGCAVDAVATAAAPALSDLAPLNQRLADAIARGDLMPDHPGLADHLRLTTLAKLAVDQPGYDTYRRWMAADAHLADPAARAAPAAPAAPAKHAAPPPES